MHRTQRAIMWFLIFVVTVPGLVSAAYTGRLIGRVVDPEGNPVEGVLVTVTSPDVKCFSVVKTSDRKGTFVVDFDKVEVTYHYTFEKAGYQTVETDQHWSLVGKTRHDFVIYPGEAPTADSLPDLVSSDPVVQGYLAGVNAFKARDFEAARVEFEKVTRQDPEVRQAWAALSVVQLELGRYQEAVESAEKALALGATDETVLRSRWEACRHLDDEAKTAQALHDLQAYGRATEEARRVYNEGVALAKTGDHEGAFARFQEALAVDPNLKEGLFAVATEGLQVKRYQESLDAAGALLKVDPHDEQALRVRYNAALGLGDEEVLVDALMGLATVEPVVARDSLLKLAYDAYDANDMARAKALFGRVLEVDPKQPQSHYVLALIEVNDGAKEEARRHLERFLELAPGDAEADTARNLLEFLSKP